MTDSSALAAVGILMGGASRRMGAPKHGITLADDSTLLDHMVAIAETVCDTIVLCGGEPVQHAGVQVNDRPGCTGPLAGIDAVLHHVQQGRCLILPCDMPNLDPDDLRRLAATESDLALFDAPHGTKTQSLPLLIDAKLRPAVESAMTEQSGAVWAFIQSQPHARIRPPADRRSLINLNTPEELAAWLTIDGGRPSQ